MPKRTGGPRTTLKHDGAMVADVGEAFTTVTAMQARTASSVKEQRASGKGLGDKATQFVVKLAEREIEKNATALQATLEREQAAKARLRDARTAQREADRVLSRRLRPVYPHDPETGQYRREMVPSVVRVRTAGGAKLHAQVAVAGKELLRAGRLIIALRQRGATLQIRRRRAAMGVEDVLRDILEGATGQELTGAAQVIDTGANVVRAFDKPGGSVTLTGPSDAILGHTAGGGREQ